MRGWRLIVRYLGLLALLVAVALVASVLGKQFGKQRAEVAKAQETEQLDEYLNATVQGIGKGYPFPDISLWPANGGPATTVRNLLPYGGLLISFASECESCADAIRAFGEAWVKSEYNTTPIVLVTSGHSDVLAGPLAESGCMLMLYRDVGEVLRNDYKLSVARTFFAINDEGIVAAMGPAGEDVDYYENLMKQYAK